MPPLDEHEYDDEGEHDEEECELCLEQNHTVKCQCNCGECCEKLIIEATMRDAEREPRILECRPLKGVTDEQVGYLLNDRENGLACRFFDRTTRVCTIYDTRPMCCRLFNCDSPDQPLRE